MATRLDLLRTTATFLGFAALGAATSLAALLPRDTFADDPVAEVTLTAKGTRIGAVVLEGKLVEDPTAKGGWVVLVHAVNSGSAPARVAVATEVTRTVSSPMARVMPMPQAIWSEKETLALAPRQAVDRRYEVPADAAAKLTADAKADRERAAKAKPGAKRGGPPSLDADGMATRVLHGVRFLPKA
jgi:hypothetical protein